MGIIWFSSLFLILCITLFSDSVQSSITILVPVTFCSLPLTFFSLYYQWKVVKKWCVLCLLTIAIIWMQVGLLIPSIERIDFESVKAGAAGLFVLVISIVATGWLLLVRPFINKTKEATNKYFKGVRFKNGPEIFMTLLQQQRQVDTSPFEGDIQLGNADSLIQIVVGCSLFCGPCAKAHEALYDLVIKHNILIPRQSILKM